MSLASNERNLTSETGERDSSSSLFCCGEREASAPQGFVIDDEMAGHRLDFVLSRSMGLSRGFSQKLIKDGRVSLVPERRVKPSIKVSPGDVMNVVIPEIETLDLEPEDVPFDVVFSDEDVIVINKPAGLVVHPAPGHWSHTLVHGLLYRFPDMGALNGVQRPGIVHRLDSTTSGLMVAARNGLALEGLFRDFKARRVSKEYLALCYGAPKSQRGEVRYPVGRDPYNRFRMAVTEDGRDAWTDFSVIWSSNGYSLVSCRLHTGRTHQIRVHMAAIGCPIVGDRLYAPSRKSPFGEERVFLHSWKLAFCHPRSGKMVSFRAPLPAELAEFLKDISPKAPSLRQ